MSKVVTIPKDRNQFIVIVNGVEYKYPAGATIEVPDSVADVIEKYEGAKPKPDPTPTPGGGSGGSVQTDWNQKDETEPDFLKNKPFGDMPTGGDTLYFDGNTEGLEYIDADGDGSFLIVRLCDTVVTKEDVANGYSFMVHMNGIVTGTIDGETAQSEFQDNGFGSLADAAIVFPYDGFYMDGITIAKAGVYTLVSNGRGVPFSITIPGYTGFPVTKKIEEKYLPGAVILYADESLTYLYNSSDTSNAENRVTLAELKELMLSGIPIQVLYSGFIYCMATNFVDAGDMGGFGMLSILMEGVSTTLYTAEYVPE